MSIADLYLFTCLAKRLVHSRCSTKTYQWANSFIKYTFLETTFLYNQQTRHLWTPELCCFWRLSTAWLGLLKMQWLAKQITAFHLFLSIIPRLRIVPISALIQVNEQHSRFLGTNQSFQRHLHCHRGLGNRSLQNHSNIFTINKDYALLLPPNTLHIYQFIECLLWAMYNGTLSTLLQLILTSTH